MSRTCIYTFRTNPYVAELKKCGAKVFVLGRLKEDIMQLLDVIEREQPERVIGVALVRERGTTRAEVKAINQFGRRAKVNKKGAESYDLTNPAPHLFKDAHSPTRTFCNWTAYKIAEFLHMRNISSAHGFIHFRADDIELLYGYFQRNY